MKKNLCVILVLAVIFSAFPFGISANASDLDNCWAKGNIEAWIESGIINCYPDGTFRPDHHITRAEFMSIINNAFNYTEKADISYRDVPIGSWFEETVQRAEAAGYISGYGDGTIKPDNRITRQEAAVIIARIKKLKGNDSEAEIFTDSNLLPEWCRALVGAVAKAGIMKGYPDGSFRGTAFTSRAEAVAALKHASDYKSETGELYDQPGVYGPESGVETITGDVHITAGGIELRNLIIKGNLYIDKSAEAGNVTLRNVKVTGLTEVTTKGTTTLVGQFELVRVRSEEAVLDLPLGTIVTTLVVEAKARITGKGIVQIAKISVSGVVFDYAPLQINIAPEANSPVILNSFVVVSPEDGGAPQPELQQVAKPTASLAPGTYEGQQSVTLASTTTGAGIWYTLDGTDPKTSITRLQYSAAINLSATTTIKAYAFKTGMLDSEVQSFSYVINMDSAAVAADKNALHLGFAVGDSESGVTQNIDLPVTGANGSVITWSSTNEASISVTGVVTRGNTDQVVALTATITKGTAHDVRVFNVTVKALPEQTGNYSRSYPVMAYDPENNRYMTAYFRIDREIGDYSLYGRLVDINGSYMGDEFLIRASVDADSYYFKPDIAYDSTNKVFLVVWNEFDSIWDVYGQILNPDGSKSGEPFAISDINDGKRQNSPFAAFDNVNNKFLVAYKNNIDANEVQDDIYGRFVNITSGSPVVGNDFLIAGGMWYQEIYDVEFDGENHFMIPIGSYESNRVVTIDSLTGSAANAYVFGSTAYRPSLAFDNVNNRFLAAWMSGNIIYGRFLNRYGIADGDTFQISDGMDIGYGNVSVDYSAGYFYVAWQNEKIDEDIDIFAKTIDAVSGELSSQIMVADGAEATLCPFVCGNGNGALVAWTTEIEPKVIGIKRLLAPDTPSSFTIAPQAADVTLPASITVNIAADKPAMLYYAVVQEDALGFETPAPTAQQLRVLGDPDEAEPDSYGIVPVLAAGCQLLNGGQSTEQIIIPSAEGFYAMRTYTVYMVMETGEGIFSPVAGATFNTLADGNAPVFNQTGTTTGVVINYARSFIITEKTLDYDEYYDLYIWAVKAEDALPGTPAATDVKANGKMYEYLTSGMPHTITYTGLEPATAYKVYMVAQDYSGDVEGIYSEVLTISEATIVNDPGPDKAGLTDDDCYVFSNDGASRNKYLLIQCNQQLSADNAGTLPGNIRIYDYTEEKSLAERGDTVTIIGDTVRITFAVPPAEDFQVYINAGVLEGAGTQIVNKYEIDVSIDVPDITPAEFITDYPMVYTAGTGDQSIAVEVCFNEDAAVFWALLPEGASEPQYESSIIDRTMLNALNYGSASVDMWERAVIGIAGLQPGTSYDLWITVADANNNYMTKQKITISTTAS